MGKILENNPIMLDFNLILAFVFQPTGGCHFVVKLHIFLQSIFLIKPSEVLQNFWRILYYMSVSEQDNCADFLTA